MLAMVSRYLIYNKLFVLVVFLFLISTFSFGQKKNDYYRFIDSADFHVSKTSDKAQLFLDSIPRPLSKFIKDSVPYYHIVQGFIHGVNQEDAKAFQSFLLAIKQAEINKDYEIAGDACIQAFRSVFPNSDNKSVFKYLDKAKYYYKLADNKYGLYEIELLDAYVKCVNDDYVGSNKTLLNNLQKYKDVINEDAYLYADASSQIALNYIVLDSIKKAHKYFKELKTVKNNPTITIDNYNCFNGIVNAELANYYLKNKHFDSTIYYLQKTNKYLNHLDHTYITSYYNTAIDAYKLNKNYNLEKKYLDSLAIHQNYLLENNIDATIQINDTLYRVDDELKEVNKNTFFNKLLIFSLIGLLVLTSFIYIIFHKKNKFKLSNASDEVDKLIYLKSNNEQLAVKVLGLEGYINNLKKEIKEISTLDDISQRNRIQEFYKNLHHNSATILDKTDNHLELVNDLNVDFFKELNEKYPQLNDSEIIVCYYLSIGFKNKEIAVFLNSSVRAIESKRYRITKKMNLKKITLSDYLNETF